MARAWYDLFLYALSETCNVTHSAAVAGITRQAAYKARHEDPDFALAWDDACEQGVDSLEMEARRRAKEGVLEPIFYRGERVADVRKYSDVLIIFLLKAHRPEKYRDVQKIGLEELLAMLPDDVAGPIRQRLGEIVFKR